MYDDGALFSRAFEQPLGRGENEESENSQARGVRRSEQISIFDCSSGANNYPYTKEAYTMSPSSTTHPKEKPTVVFVAFESEYAAYGGLGAVMRLLPKEMVAVKDGLPSFVLAPYFKQITDLVLTSSKGIRTASWKR